MTKEEAIKRALNQQGAFLLNDINTLVNSSFCKIVINEYGEILSCYPVNKDATEELLNYSRKAALHIASISTDLLLWVWENEHTCLCMKP